MDPATAIIAGGAMSTVGSAIGSALGFSAQDKSLRFQKQMAKNKHQWEVADLRAAGLNPILSAGGGGGGGLGGAAFTPAQNPLEGVGSGLKEAARFKAIERVRMDNETRLANSSTAKQEAEAALLRAEEAQVKVASELKALELEVAKKQMLEKGAVGIRLDEAQQELATSSAKTVQLKQEREKLYNKAFELLNKFLLEGLDKLSKEERTFIDVLPPWLKKYFLVPGVQKGPGPGDWAPPGQDPSRGNSPGGANSAWKVQGALRSRLRKRSTGATVRW